MEGKGRGGASLCLLALSVLRQLREIINTGAARSTLDGFVSFSGSTFGGLSPSSTGKHLLPQEVGG